MVSDSQAKICLSVSVSSIHFLFSSTYVPPVEGEDSLRAVGGRADAAATAARNDLARLVRLRRQHDVDAHGLELRRRHARPVVLESP